MLDSAAKSFFTLFPLLFIPSHDASSQRFRGLDHSGLLPPLVFPPGGTLKLLFGYSTPITMPGKRIMSYTQNFQFQFSLPQNVTLFREYFKPSSLRRRKRQTDDANMIAERSIFYRHLEDELRRRIGKRDCLKRSICEYAGEETSLKDDGLVGEILHVLLTPDYSVGGGGAGDDNEFREAARVGRRKVDCSEAYPSCPKGFGILDHISKLLDD